MRSRLPLECRHHLFLPALPRGYTDRYTQRYREGPNMPRRGSPCLPPRPPSAPLGGASPITASIHPYAPPRDLFNNAGPSS
jgi:hypothetical protein